MKYDREFSVVIFVLTFHVQKWVKMRLIENIVLNNNL